MLRRITLPARPLLFALAGALTFAPMAGTAPAHAATNASTCQFNGNVTLAPTLPTVLTNFTFSLNGSLTGCAPSSGLDPATFAMNGTGIGSCFDFNGGGVATIQWADGSRSTVNLTIQEGLDVFEMTEAIVSGPLAGDTAYAVLSFEPDGICGLGNVGGGALLGTQTSFAAL